MKKKRLNHGQASKAKTPELPDSSALEAGPMVRTQVYLTRVEHEFLSMEASRRSEPMAAVLRSFIDERMRIPESAWDNNPLLTGPAPDPDFVGQEDASFNHDHYLYGVPKKWIKREGRWAESPPLPADYYSNRESAAAYDRQLEEQT